MRTIENDLRQVDLLQYPQSRDKDSEPFRLLEERPEAGLYSTCRTCEIGMTRAVGRPFRSLLHLVHEAVARG